jgi:hypothetical protein
LACGASGIPGIPGMSFIGAPMFVEQQFAGCEQHPPPQALAASAEHITPQQLKTEVAKIFNI